MFWFGGMNMGLESAQKIQLNNITHSTRASQAVLQYGVGAMVDFPDQTLMTAAPEYWQERVVKIHDERLEKALHVDYFGMPGGKDDAHCKEGISYVRFPEWYFCPKCRKFQPIKTWVEDYQRKARQSTKEKDPFMIKHMRCTSCKQDLVVARIVTVCEHGHIDDFPWVKWVHCQSYGGAKKVCNQPALTFKTGASSTDGLEGLVVTCESCHAKATLKGAFDVGKFEELDKRYKGEYKFTCAGRHPWKNKKESCKLYPRVLQRGSSSVYFPVTASSLVIPPYSSILTTKIENSGAFTECRSMISAFIRMPEMTQEMKNSFVASQIDTYSQKIGLEIGIPKAQIKPVLERKWRQPSSEEYSTLSIKYKSEEYDALSGEISFGNDEYGDFQREQTDISKYGLPYVNRISLIHKVREVQALTGFSRIKPTDKSEQIEKQGNVVSVKEPETNWYPAYEVRGEGLFIEFDSNAIGNWRNENEELRNRVDILNNNYKKSFIGSGNPRTISEKFVLLHTISHLLIKQLSFECGYSIASLKERIYCSEASEGKDMSGILIYTASGDSEGTMGGLVRQGQSDTFPNIFRKAIQSGMACSNDPICSLSIGQGRDSLNLAACYSCALIPETSCEEFNSFLDRGTVVGTFNNSNLGFYCEQVFDDNKWEIQSRFVPTNTSDGSDEQFRILIPDTGTDMRDLDYAKIWKSVRDWTNNPIEKELLDSLISSTDMFSTKEKPIYDCSFMLSGDTEKYVGTLVWKKSKAIYFSAEYCDVYEKAMHSDWKCFCGDDRAVTVDVIVGALKEK